MSEEKKDLGILMNSELKLYKETAVLAKNANSRLGLKRKSFSLKDEETLPCFLSH